LTVSGTKFDYAGHDLEAMFFARNYHAWILDYFRPSLGRHLLEVGAGLGHFSRLLLSTVPESHHAFEPSDTLFPKLKLNLQPFKNTHPYHAFLDADLMPGVRLDTAVYVNVLEHIAEDREELEKVWALLEPGGHLCLFVPAHPWLFGAPDRYYGHFRRYEKAGLERLVKSVGYEIMDSRYMDLVGIVPWWILYKLLRRKKIIPNQVALYDILVIPLMRIIETWFPPFTGKNIGMIARKPA